MSTSPSRIPAIRYWSNRISWLLLVCLISVPILVVLALVMSRLHGLELYIWSPGPIVLSSLPPITAAVVGLAALVTLMLFTVPAYFLQRMFRSWARGDILTRSAARSLKRAGLWLFFALFFATVVVPLLAMGISPWFDATLPIKFTLELDGLLAGGITYVVGMVLDEAALVAEEAELTI